MRILSIAILTAVVLLPALPTAAQPAFHGRHYDGRGDIRYLQLLELARRMFQPDAEYQNLSMLYTPAWNGFVEGPTWNAWWIQNSYGTTYCILPFLQEPWITFLQNSQDLWFDQMGDGKRVGAPAPMDWVAPDGCLCDAARPGWIVYKQGDGRIQIHDWAMEFTAAGLLLQCELLLISRDQAAIAHYLPKLERCAAFLQSRRDPKTNLYLAGPAANLLAPSYAGWKRPDGTYGMAYLTGLSVTTIAALDRLIELERLAGRPAQGRTYALWRSEARKGLTHLFTPDGYLIRSLDPDGTRHGVYGAPIHGYFEAPPNHDAIAFRVVNDTAARRIFARIASIPQIRPHTFILPNYPSYDDMYEKPEGLWAYGTWVNGGHWSTCEARMILAYYRLGRYGDAQRSMEALLAFARRFRMDNPLTKCGSDVYQPQEPINLCYDAFGPPAAFLRGLFEYLYKSDRLILIPHIPPSITYLNQKDPVRFGTKRIYLSVQGRGAVTRVRVNGKDRPWHTRSTVSLPYDLLPAEAHVQIRLGGPSQPARASNPGPTHGVSALFAGRPPHPPTGARAPIPEKPGAQEGVPPAILVEVRRAARFRALLNRRGMASSYEAAHARLVEEALEALRARRQKEKAGTLPALPEPARSAADASYLTTVQRLAQGLAELMARYASSRDAHQRALAALWAETAPNP
ncbi:MAG: hypothetical protein ACP5VE_07105 [Chthonomonadales bacterium]